MEHRKKIFEKYDCFIKNGNVSGFDFYSTIRNNRNSLTFETPDIFIKQVYLLPDDLALVLDEGRVPLRTIFNADTSSVWREIFILKMCTILLSEDVSPHFPFHYGHVFSMDETGRPLLFLFEEKMDMDLKMWLSRHEPDDNDWMNIFLQLFFALYGLQTQTGVCHNDLHWGNILMKTYDTPQTFTYKIHDTVIELSCQTFLLLLCDFGHATFDPCIEKGSSNSLKDFQKVVLHLHSWSGDIITPSIQIFIDEITNTKVSSMRDLFFHHILHRVEEVTKECPKKPFDMTKKNIEFPLYSL